MQFLRKITKSTVLTCSFATSPPPQAEKVSCFYISFLDPLWFAIDVQVHNCLHYYYSVLCPLNVEWLQRFVYTQLQVNHMQLKDRDIGPFLLPLLQILCIRCLSSNILNQATVIQHRMHVPLLLLHHCHQWDQTARRTYFFFGV